MPDTGTKMYRNSFTIPFGTQIDAKYGFLYPVFRKLVYPGDVFKIHADLLIRYQPMLAPPMNDAVATVRFGFVPLRLIEKNIELIITGSNDGKLSTDTLPVCNSVFHDLETGTGKPVNVKGSQLDLLYGIPAISDDLTNELKTKLEASPASPAQYFSKAYERFWWDYYRDENINPNSDFETYWSAQAQKLNKSTSIHGTYLRKDYFTSSLPWQLKAVSAPRIEVIGTGTFSNGTLDFSDGLSMAKNGTGGVTIKGNDASGQPIITSGLSETQLLNLNENFKDVLESGTVSGDLSELEWVGISGSDIRDVLAQTRIYERLARCGSRYTEYLRANFGIAPSDGTLQRAQYLGGFKTHIVTTEVVQTAGAGDNPVGTLRGHGITHGTSTIKPFLIKEPGVVIGVLDIKPETIYAQGVDRELCARSRFDFLNPSFQHLSEQEVRKGEIFFGIDTNTDGSLKNDDTWGFQPYAQELRKGVKHVAGEMRDTLSYWNQALIFSSRPSLNNSFLSSVSHLASYNRPFNVVDNNVSPMVVDFGGIIQAYRPLVKDGTPGLADHN